MKILVVLLILMVGAIKSDGRHSLADLNQKSVDVAQIATNEIASVNIQQRPTTGRWVEISTVLFFMSMTVGHRKLKEHLLLVEQIHEMKEAIEELERLNSVKDILLSIISHDIRTPLVSLKSILELIASKKLTTSEFIQLVVELDNQLVHVNGFIENLLYWAKENRARIKPSTESVALRPLIKETIRLLSFNAKKKQITIQTDVPVNVMIYADAEMIKLVLRNLISNAIKFSNVNDKIYIGAISENEMVKVSVEDTGEGISEKCITTLFNISHLSATGTDDEIGVGLGLTLCKEFVGKMGGEISVASKLGKGSCFQFTVPRFIKNKTAAEAALAI